MAYSEMYEFVCDLISGCDEGSEELSPAMRERAEKIICGCDRLRKTINATKEITTIDELKAFAAKETHVILDKEYPYQIHEVKNPLEFHFSTKKGIEWRYDDDGEWRNELVFDNKVDALRWGLGIRITYLKEQLRICESMMREILSETSKGDER